MFDRAETTATAFLGLTLECARCHDHKFDPLTQREYYQFAAFFNNVNELGMTGDDGDYGPLMLLPSEQDEQRLQDLETDLAAAESELAHLLKEARRIYESQKAAPSLPDLSAITATPTAIHHFALERADASDGGSKPPFVIDEFSIFDDRHGARDKEGRSQLGNVCIGRIRLFEIQGFMPIRRRRLLCGVNVGSSDSEGAGCGIACNNAHSTWHSGQQEPILARLGVLHRRGGLPRRDAGAPTPR